MNKINYDVTGDSLFSVEAVEDDVPVTCLGIEFKNDKKRKEYFLNLLAKKLKDPEFRKIEGFPIGSDDDILALSDPPYYCACPNPWLNDFIKEWESEKPAKPADWVYKREPFAADVSEGKSDPVYMAHTYHTKVPYKAVKKYIEHYTDPGDIVFDGFCGSGMTGLAAQECEQPRRAIIGDLSPVATFISDSFTSSISLSLFRSVAETLISDCKSKYSWIYETWHNKEMSQKGQINYVIWSDVLVCPNCGESFVFWDVAIGNNKQVYKTFNCPHCEATLSKKDCTHYFETIIDSYSKKTIALAKQQPVLINYIYNGKKYEKKPDSDDLVLLEKCKNLNTGLDIPFDELPKGDKIEEPIKTHGFNHVNHFYFDRSAILFDYCFNWARKSKIPNQIIFALTSILVKSGSKLHNVGFKNGKINLAGAMPNVVYIPSINAERNIIELLDGKIKDICSVFALSKDRNNVAIQCCSATKSGIDDSSIDYIFTDPPFGSNINYSEMNFIWESWLKVKTDNKEEAIINKTQNKVLASYQDLLISCFEEYYRILKPGHWMTVEFSNTDSSIWNAIQFALSNAGFIIASVNALDKQQGSYNAQTSQSAVKQDLAITVYKPDSSFDTQIAKSNGTDGVWTFVRKHLEYLPTVKETGIEHKFYGTVPDRDPRILYDRLVSYYVGHNILLPISSPDFLAGLGAHFIERDGLFYLPEQVAYYDKLKAQNKIGDEDTTGSLFVHDESSAIAWIREQLRKKTMTTGEMTPLFLQELNSWDKNEKRLELAEILEENFLRYDGVGDVPSPIHSYLSTNFKELRNMDKDNPALMAKAKGRWYVPDPNKQADLEKLREKGLLREFNGYLQTKGKLKEFRLEAVRAGFKKAWSDKDYKLIMDFAARIPSSVIEEDPKLLMWYNGAVTRSER